MYCKSGGTTCRFPGRLSSEGYIFGVVKKKGAASIFGLQVMLGGSLCVSGPCKLQIYCGTRTKLY